MDPEVYYYHYGPQPMKRQLSLTQKGLWQVGKAFCRIFVYSPLLFSSYWITLQFLDRKAPVLWWIGCVAGFALLLYQLLFLLKGILIGLKQKGNLLWLLLLAFCVSFTCILPAYLAIKPAVYLATKINCDQSFGPITVILLCLYIYSCYNFHKDSANKMALGAYKAGKNFIL